MKTLLVKSLVGKFSQGELVMKIHEKPVTSMTSFHPHGKAAVGMRQSSLSIFSEETKVQRVMELAGWHISPGLSTSKLEHSAPG